MTYRLPHPGPAFHRDNFRLKKVCSLAEMQIVPGRRSDPEFSRHEIGPKRACNVRQAAIVAFTPLQVEPRSAPCSPGFPRAVRKLDRIETKHTSTRPGRYAILSPQEAIMVRTLIVCA